jgi:hypothetical protein
MIGCLQLIILEIENIDDYQKTIDDCFTYISDNELFAEFYKYMVFFSNDWLPSINYSNN